jgi:hypothetical protein
MARQESSCWHCGAQWASENVPQTTLRAFPGALLAQPAAEAARFDMRDDDERWANEGGGLGSEVAPAPLRVAARG